MPTVLWWGRCERDYSRNRIIARLFTKLGWRIDYFHPVSSQLGLVESYLRRPRRPDLIWVPCFRQRDMHSALHWAGRWQVPLIFEPLTSAYEKEVYERKKWPPGSKQAERRKRWESNLFMRADMVVLENPAYVDFVHREMGIPKNRMGVLYQGAFTDFFRPMPPPPATAPFEIVFTGSFHPSMGTDVIVAAARMAQDLPCIWVLIGEGDMKPAAVAAARGLANVRFEPWTEYRRLPRRLSAAHVLLGIFGETHKTDFVIPNKVFEAMAVGRPLITQTASSYAETVGGSDVIGWVPRGNPEAVAATVRRWMADPAALARRGEQTRNLFDTHFGHDRQSEMLEEILGRVMTGMERK
jgi:glycosyltransferase involved in cell wall biosynthesis